MLSGWSSASRIRNPSGSGALALLGGEVLLMGACLMSAQAIASSKENFEPPLSGQLMLIDPPIASTSARHRGSPNPVPA
eukprot:5340693-Prymnesium_polylepis.2